MYGQASSRYPTLSPARVYHNMTWLQWRRIIRVVADATAFFFVLLVFVLCYTLIRKLPPPRLGFFCDDQSIRLPWKDSTVPDWALIVGAVAIPFAAVRT